MVLVIGTVRLLKLTSTSIIKFIREEADSYYVTIKYPNPYNPFISKAKLPKCRYQIKACATIYVHMKY